MRVMNVVSYSLAAVILVFLAGHTLGSPVGVKSETEDVATTVASEIVNDDVVVTTTRTGGRQEEPEDEDDDDDATSAPVIPSTVAPVPKPQYNESTIQSELNYVSQFQIGSNDSETLPQVPPQAPEVPAPSGSVPVPANPVENNSSIADPVVESRNSSVPVSEVSEAPAPVAPAAPVVPSIAPVPVVSSSAAPVPTEEDDDDDDESTGAPAVRQPAEEEAEDGESPAESSPAEAAAPAIPVKPLTLASSPPVVQSQAQSAAIGNAAVPQPAVPAKTPEAKPVATAAQTGAQPQEVDSDNEDSDTDPDTENEITQDQRNSDAVVPTTGAPTTFEAEYNYTVQFINDNNQARKQIVENDESDEGNSTVKPLNNKSTFESEFQHTSQFLSDADGRADCACGKVPYSVPLGPSSGINESPWTVAIVRGGLFGGGRPHCGGTLINDKYVITASHCMDGLYPNDIQVWMTVHNSFESASSFGTSKVNVQEIIMHPNYNRNTNDNDVALIKLSQPIDISQKNYFVPACIPAGSSDYSGTTARVTAWSNGRRNEICKAEMPVLSNHVCTRDTKHQDKITENMLCAGFLTPSKQESCIGDAGGPLVSPNGGRNTLIGVVSWGYRSAGQYSPTVYTRVSGYSDWILHNTRDADWCGN